MRSEASRKGSKVRSYIKNEEIGITGGRGLAALYIFAYHALASYWVYLGVPITASTVFYPSIYSFLISGCGIDFFFVLSAYLLTKKMTKGDYPNLKFYFTKRIFRIWPMFYLFMISFSLLGLYEPRSWLTYVFAMNYFPSTFENNQLWTLMVEELFYLILPLWIQMFVKGRMKYALPILLLITLAYRIASPTGNISYFDKQIPSFLFDYALGTALGLGGAGIRKKVTLKKRRWKYGLIALFVAFASMFPNGYIWFMHPVYAAFYFLMIANFSNSAVLTNRVTVYLGRISYPFSLFGTFILTSLGTSRYLGLFNIGASAYEAWEWVLTSLAITVILAIVTHYWVERPGIGLGQKVIARFGLASRPDSEKKSNLPSVS